MNSSIDMLSSDEEEMIRLLQLCCQRIELRHDANTSKHVDAKLKAGEALHTTCKAILRKLPDFMW